MEAGQGKEPCLKATEAAGTDTETIPLTFFPARTSAVSGAPLACRPKSTLLVAASISHPLAVNWIGTLPVGSALRTLMRTRFVADSWPRPMCTCTGRRGSTAAS